MPTECGPPTEWTVDSLKEYVDQRFVDNERYLRQVQKAASEAIRVATAAHEKRLDGMNEFRESLSDQSNKLTPRDLFNSHTAESRETHAEIRKRVEVNHSQLLTLTASESGGRDREAQARANIAALVAVISVAIAFASLIYAIVGVIDPWPY